MLAIGRALLTNGRLLLLDEPSEGLAPLIVREIGRVRAAAQGGAGCPFCSSSRTITSRCAWPTAST